MSLRNELDFFSQSQILILGFMYFQKYFTFPLSFYLIWFKSIKHQSNLNLTNKTCKSIIASVFLELCTLILHGMTLIRNENDDFFYSKITNTFGKLMKMCKQNTRKR